jgi:hypothetical protein
MRHAAFRAYCYPAQGADDERRAKLGCRSWETQGLRIRNRQQVIVNPLIDVPCSWMTANHPGVAVRKCA